MSKHPKLVSIKVRNGDINRALKKFKRTVNESGHLLELRERQYYTKPTTKRRKQKLEAKREQYKNTILEKIAEGNTKVSLPTKKRKKRKNTKNKPTKK